MSLNKVVDLTINCVTFGIVSDSSKLNSWCWLLRRRLWYLPREVVKRPEGVIKGVSGVSFEKGCLNERATLIGWIPRRLLWLVVRT